MQDFDSMLNVSAVSQDEQTAAFVAESRNQMIEEHESTDAVDEILLKVIGAPITKERRGWWRGEER